MEEPQCYKLSQLNDFSDYIKALRSETSFNETKLSLCRSEICIAVYGTGNPDISGIGVAIAYILEFVLSVLLSLATIILRKSQPGTRAYRWKEIMHCGLDSFFSSAAYFALAIQLATIIVLIRKDYGISTADLGAIEARIAQSVAVVSMMPLLYPAALLEPQKRNINRDIRHNARLLLLNATIALSFFPFLSRCIHGFGPSPIGTGDDQEVDPEDWAKVAEMCLFGGFGELKKDLTWKALPGLELTASLITYFFAFWLLSGLPNTRYIPDENTKGYRGVERVLSWRERVAKWFDERWFSLVAPLLLIIGLTIPLVVMIFKLRDLQKELSNFMGESYEGDNWGFGQIVSIVLFFPVGVDMAYSWRFGSAYEQ